MTERQIAIEIIGQKTIRVDYDWGVSFYDLADYFSKGQKFLSELAEAEVRENNPMPLIDEGIISGPKVDVVYRINDCLVDNKLVPTVFSGELHVFVIAGSPIEAKYLRERISMRVPRHFPCMPNHVNNTAAFDRSEVYSVESDFDLNAFPSAEEVYIKLKES